MTIYTNTPAQDKDAEGGNEKAEKETLVKPSVVDSAENQHEALQHLHTLHRNQSFQRRRLLTSFFVTIVIFWLLLAGFMVIYLLLRQNEPRIYAWCSAELMNSKSAPLKERVEVNAKDEYEKIEVPQFGGNRPAIFLHDFGQNLTAIVDVLGERCFVKPLDRAHVAPPTSLADMFRKMKTGYYEPNVAVLRERYMAQKPELSVGEVNALGSFVIAEQCRTYSTYMLHRVSDVDASNEDEGYVAAFERPRTSVRPKPASALLAKMGTGRRLQKPVACDQRKEYTCRGAPMLGEPQCIPDAWRCDGDDDCALGDDEWGCSSGEKGIKVGVKKRARRSAEIEPAAPAAAYIEFAPNRGATQYIIDF